MRQFAVLRTTFLLLLVGGFGCGIKDSAAQDVSQHVVPLASSTQPVDHSPAIASEPAQNTEELVKRLVAHPRDQDLWPSLQDPAHRKAARAPLVKAFRDPANRRKEHGIIWADGADDILAAIVSIYGSDASELVIEATHSEDPDIRAMAVRLLGDPLKSKTPEARRAIRGALSDPVYRVVENALETLVQVPDPDAEPDVLRVLHNPPKPSDQIWDRPTTWNAGSFSGHTQDVIFESSIEALGKIGFPGAIDELSRLARSPSAYVRFEAAAALAGCAATAPAAQQHRVIEQLGTMLRDPNIAVCAAAARALVELHDTRGVPALRFELVRDTRPTNDEVPQSDYEFRPTIQALQKLIGKEGCTAIGGDPWNAAAATPGAHVTPEQVRHWNEAMRHELEAHGFVTCGFPILPERLTDEEKAAFDRAFARWLTDPRRAQMIKFTYPERTAWGTTRDTPVIGWLFPASHDHPKRVLLDDGQEFAAPDKFETIDFVESQRGQIRDALAAKSVWPDATEAAWLYRLGHEDLAAQILWLVRGNGDRSEINLDWPAEQGAWRAFAGAVHAYLVGQDAEALTYAERLAKLYPDHVDQFGPGAKLLGELRRRKSEGSFHDATRPPTTMPTTFAAGFGDWPVERQVSQLIHDLQDVEARQQGQPGGVDLSADPRVERLIEIGDPAVPALIDCIDNDERLTRSIHFWRDFAQSRGILSVREAALVAVQSILGTTIFEPVATGDDFTARGEDLAKATARQLRAYWNAYGNLPFDRRMMKILTDPAAKPAALREAASNLANMGGQRRIGTMVWTTRVHRRPGPSPIVGKFTKPTVAEAILAARDRDVAALPTPSKRQWLPPDQDVERVDDGYAEDLIALGDRAIVSELLRRVTMAQTVREKRLWSTVAQQLGDDRPLRALAAAFEAGSIPLPANGSDIDNPLEQPGNRELGSLIACLSAAHTDYCEKALNALETPMHPYAGAALACAMYAVDQPQYGVQDVWLAHPFHVRLLAPMLEDRTPTGGTWTRDGDYARLTGGTGHCAWTALPPPAERIGVRVAQSAPERRCDWAAIHLSECLIGVPAYNPLMGDAEARLDALRAYLSRYGSRLRPLEYIEMSAAQFDAGRLAAMFVPDLVIDSHPATAGDVASGKAIFAAGQGASPVANVKLPALGTVRDTNGVERVLVVQAERDASGRVRYGIIARRQIRAVAADELSELKALGEAANQ